MGCTQNYGPLLGIRYELRYQNGTLILGTTADILRNPERQAQWVFREDGLGLGFRLQGFRLRGWG